ncbi:MAG: hypothetical protein ABSF25_21105 [Bryobacteraceae bacterium]
MARQADQLSETRRLAEQGDAEAQDTLAYAYYRGQGVPQDYAEAAKWYRKAAEQGEAVAQHSLGTLYRFAKESLRATPKL